MASTPRISLVLPSYNAASTIERTLRSIEDQRYPDLQLLCIDGGSTDGTVERIQRFRPLVSALVSEKDAGVADAINKGFRRADGEIFCWLGADDELASGALHHVARAFAEHPEADVVTGGCRRFFADGSVQETAVPEWFLATMAFRLDIEQPSTFWRAALHRRIGELDTSYRLAFDWELWNRFLAHGARFVREKAILSHYHFSDTNLTSRSGARQIEEMERITATYGSPRVAAAYRFLYRTFDLRGYYDVPEDALPPVRRLVFRTVRSAMRRIYGRVPIDCYNWNWASKQVRGLVWYK